MRETYVHGYDPRESERLHDQAGTLVELLHGDTSYPAGSTVLEAGCGVGAQTVTLAARSPGARVASIDVSAESVAEARGRVDDAGLTNVELRQADIFALPFAPARSTTCSSASSSSTSPAPSRRWRSCGTCCARAAR